MMGSLYGRPYKRAYVIQQNFLNAHMHCLNSEAKGVLPSSPAKGSKLHIQIPAEDLQEFNRNNDSLSITWLPGTKALHTSYSHSLNDAFRKKKKKGICFVWTLQSPGFSFYSPILFPSRKRNCLKGKGFPILESQVRFSCSLVKFTTVVTAFYRHHTWFGITSNLIHFSGFGLSYEVTVMLLQSSFLWIFKI